MEKKFGGMDKDELILKLMEFINEKGLYNRFVDFIDEQGYDVSVLEDELDELENKKRKWHK